MATVYGTNATIQNASGPPDSYIKPGLWGGKVRVMCDTYEAVSLVSGSTIAAAYLPKDAIVLGLSNILTDALGSGVTIAAGITGTTGKFLAAVVCHTAKGRGLAEAEFNYRWHTHAPHLDKAQSFLTELNETYCRPGTVFDRTRPDVADGGLRAVVEEE